MRLIDVYAKLKEFNQPIMTTKAISALLNIKRTTASKLLARLAKNGLLVRLKRGLWGIADRIDVLTLPAYLTSPFPSYISLHSALYYHGMISQIPNIIYAVSLARSKKITTPLGTVSIHHIQPDLFFGFKAFGEGTGQMATSEKALFDMAYFSTAKSKLFAALPELELPKSFDRKKVFTMLRKIKAINRRTVMKNYLTRFIPLS